MKLVVGLGNPGQKYVGTRHNIGFEAIAELARRYNVGRPKAKHDGELAEASINNEKTILLCPLTFMNLSGKCVQPIVDFYKLEPEQVLVICDDLNLDLARLRLKPSGSAGGQNGLKDIIQRLGTNSVPRLRIGVGKPPPRWDVSDYVLGKFEKDDLPVMEKGVKRAADAVETWISKGIQEAMNKFNADPNAPPRVSKSAKKSAPGPNESQGKQTIEKPSDDSPEAGNDNQEN